MFLELIKIVHLLPCLADPEKIRFIGYFDKNVSEIFPYLNTILDEAIFNREGKSLTIKKEGRLITLQPNKIAAGSEEISVPKCAELFSGNFTDKRAELLGLLKAAGYDVPGVFAPDKHV